MDHHRQIGRLPVRIALAAAVLAVAGLAGCGGGDTLVTLGPAATTTAAPATTTTRATTTTTITTTTTTSTSTTTTTTIPLEPWQVPGRRYYFPVQPPEAAAYSAYHHDYPATDLFAPVGTTVVAVTDGVVDELRRDDPWDPAADDPAARGGRYVSIVGDDGVRYYCSHLDSVAEGLEPGGRVAAGQVIGTVGRSGNAASTPPHCHFGISRPTFPGDWEVRRGEVWPADYLAAWARGEDVTPVLPGG